MMLHTKARAKQANTLSQRHLRFYEFLKANPIAVVSTVTPDGEPHGSVVYIDVGQDLVACFLTKAGTRKADNLFHNSHIVLSVYEPAGQACVQITGEAQPITDDYELNQLAGRILSISLKSGKSGLPPISKLEAGQFVGFRILPVRARMARYAQVNTGDYGDLFESIESFDYHAID